MSPFVPGFISGFLIGTFAWFVLVILLASHRSPPPTLHRRKFRDEPIPDGVDDPARVREGVNYKWINIAGERE